MTQDNEKKHLPTQEETVSGAQPSGLKKRALWTIVFIAIAALTIWAITSQNKNFSVGSFREFLTELNPYWLIAAFLAMLAYIFLEGMAILTLCKSLGYRQSLSKGFSYSSADIYFSAITPSSTGGQPASAYFMMKDGIPGSVVTAILSINLIMYTFSILVLGVLAFLFCPEVFLVFSVPSRILILVGVGSQIGLALIFLLLIKKPAIIRWVGSLLLTLLGKLRIIRHVDRKLLRMNNAIDSYERCISSLGKRRRALTKVFCLNFLQRIALIAVSAFSFLAAGGALGELPNFSAAECMAILGYSFVPIPGAMGIADGLLIDVFSGLFGDASFATNLELLSRSVSFYLCVILCGIVFLSRCIHIARQTRREKKTASDAQDAASPQAEASDQEKASPNAVSSPSVPDET